MKKGLKANISLTLVIIAGTFLLMSGITILLVTMDIARSSQNSESYELNVIQARSCLEEGLEKLKASRDYTGTVNLAFVNGTCTATTINVPGGNPNLKQITVASVLGDTNYGTVKFVDVSTVPFAITNP